MTVVTNDEFARLTGCTYTMASKLRNGARKPSGSLLTRIILVFQLDAQEATEAYQQILREYPQTAQGKKAAARLKGSRKRR